MTSVLEVNLDLDREAGVQLRQVLARIVHVILTGTRCTTLTKFPVALSGGIIENRAPVPAEMLSTLPWSL